MAINFRVNGQVRRIVTGGTSHAWSNRSDKPCSVLFAMIPSRPL